MRQNILISLLVTATVFLSACETLTSSRRTSLFQEEKWALLPIENFSTTPLAGDNAKALVETHLRSRGVRHLEEFKPTEQQNLLAILDTGTQLRAAKKWAIENGYRYAVTGKVQEWHYKNGLDNEPAVGLSLKFMDLQTNEVLWHASASRTGWGYANLSSVASKTIGDLLSEVRIRGGHAKPVPASRATAIANRESSARTPATAAALPDSNETGTRSSGTRSGSIYSHPTQNGTPQPQPVPGALEVPNQ